MLYDAFLFNNELELLEIRLYELGPVVEGFVLVESPYTFQGKSKPLYYDEHRDWFHDYNITHVVTPLPNVGDDVDAWENERFMRNKISDYFEYLPHTYVLMGDADEIPSRELIQNIPIGLELPVRIEQRLSYYYLNTVTEKPWYGTILIDQPNLVRATAQQTRDCIWSVGMPTIVGGWHFSYLGGPQRIQEKLRSFAHTEYNTSYFTNLNYIKRSMKNGTDLLGRDESYHKIAVDNSFPHLIQEHPEKFENLIVSP